MAYEDDGASLTSYAIFIVVLFAVISHTILPVQDKTLRKKSEDLFCLCQ